MRKGRRDVMSGERERDRLREDSYADELNEGEALKMLGVERGESPGGRVKGKREVVGDVEGD